MNLKLVNVPTEAWQQAAKVAKDFDAVWPERSGIRQGVAYTDSWQAFYVYRTKTSIVVRLSDIGGKYD